MRGAENASRADEGHTARSVPASDFSPMAACPPPFCYSRVMSEPSQLLQAALALEPRERAELVEAIAASLDGFGLGPDWEDEIKKRVDDVDSGRVKSSPGEDVLDRLEQRLRAR
jgi:putative addiction module component (TIGR02574 family)